VNHEEASQRQSKRRSTPIRSMVADDKNAEQHCITCPPQPPSGRHVLAIFGVDADQDSHYVPRHEECDELKCSPQKASRQAY
jgi:hypothetical protein